MGCVLRVYSLCGCALALHDAAALLRWYSVHCHSNAPVMSCVSLQCLSVLKDDGVREPAKQKAVEKVIGIMKSEDFNRLVNYGKAIKDFVTDGGAAESV